VLLENREAPCLQQDADSAHCFGVDFIDSLYDIVPKLHEVFGSAPDDLLVGLLECFALSHHHADFFELACSILRSTPALEEGIVDNNDFFFECIQQLIDCKEASDIFDSAVLILNVSELLVYSFSPPPSLPAIFSD
jgi:hypothetical protein